MLPGSTVESPNMNKAGVFFDKLKSAQEPIALLKMMARMKKWRCELISLAILVAMIHWTGWEWDLYNNPNTRMGGFLKES